MSKRFAFTLAEVLITLGIIGVVAAITIPVLQSKIEMQQHAVALQKVYSELSQVTSKIQTPDFWADIPSGDNTFDLRDAFGTVLKYIKIDTAGNIWGDVGWNNASSTYRNYKGSAPAYLHLFNNNAAAILSDGTFIGFFSGQRVSDGHHEIYVDTNGKKPPNMFGKDVHKFLLKDINGYYKLMPSGADGTPYSSSTCTAGSTTYTTSWPCTNLLLTDPDKMP